MASSRIEVAGLTHGGQKGMRQALGVFLRRKDPKGTNANHRASGGVRRNRNILRKLLRTEIPAELLRTEREDARRTYRR